MDGGPLLTLRGFAVAAQGALLVEGLDLCLMPGELVALVGPSGCGKSTLLRAASGLIDPAGGEVLFKGQTPDEIGWPRYRRNAPYVEQQPVMLNATVLENLARPFSYHSVGKQFPRERALELLSRLGLEPLSRRRARSLSGGEQQRVALIRALLVDPAVLLLDEPTSSLDEDSALLIEDLLNEYARERGLAALIVTHDRGQAGRMCHRTVELSPYCVCVPSPPGNEAGDGGPGDD